MNSRKRAVGLNFFAAIILLLSSLPAHAAPARQDNEPFYTVGACRGIDRDNLRAEIEQTALGALTGGSGGLDIDALVARKWAELGVDAVIDAEVARAVAALSAQEGYLDRLWSGWSAEKAEEYAARIAEDAFRSPAFTGKMEEVAQAIGAEIARSIDAEFARAASVAFLCLQEYVGDAYSAVLFEAFQTGVGAQVQQAEFSIDPAALDVSALDIHKAGLTGVSIIVVTEVARRVSTKIGEKIAQRIAGKVIGRVVGRAGSSFIPVIGWVVGIGLIAWDLYEGGQGSLPQIEEALTGEEVKERIRGEIVDAVAAGLPEETSIASLEIAVTLVEAWDAFCRNHEDLCQQAEENPSFRNLLDNTSLADLERLDALVSVFVDEIGRNHLDQAIEVGALDRLLAQPAATVLLTSTHSVTDTLAWVDLADDRLPEVIELGVAQQARPGEFDAASLQVLLALGDAQVVERVLMLDADERAALLRLPSGSLKQLVPMLTAEELRWLVGYLGEAGQAGLPVSPGGVITELASGSITLAQLQAMTTPTTAPMPTALPVLATPAPGASLADQNPSPTLVIALVGVILSLVVISFLVWRRRKIVV